jgi:hypothetical protein
MNRLILVGNGFDLAHGLKTSYHDFIKWYFKKCLQECVKGKEQAQLISVTIDTNDEIQCITDDELNAWIDSCFEDGFDTTKIGRELHKGKLWNPFTILITSELMRAILQRLSGTRWVDIEGIFYEQMISILDKHKADESKEHALKQLNKSMHLIIQELQLYLTDIKHSDKINGYFDIISDDIHSEDVQSKAIKMKTAMTKPFETCQPQETLILNFNYTDTISSYIINMPPYRKTHQIFIHGRLNNTKNPIIFGFGDEVDKRYEEIENSHAKGWFEYIKSFWYLKTNNYRELTKFIDNWEYQVVVLGHSCGLSDRTMLQMIFQHDNCRSIKLYYHGSKEINNHRQTIHEVSRHFKDKGLMRKRIVSEDSSERMPQFND